MRRLEWRAFWPPHPENEKFLANGTRQAQPFPYFTVVKARVAAATPGQGWPAGDKARVIDNENFRSIDCQGG